MPKNIAAHLVGDRRRMRSIVERNACILCHKAVSYDRGTSTGFLEGHLVTVEVKEVDSGHFEQQQRRFIDVTLFPPIALLSAVPVSVFLIRHGRGHLRSALWLLQQLWALLLRVLHERMTERRFILCWRRSI